MASRRVTQQKRRTATEKGVNITHEVLVNGRVVSSHRKKSVANKRFRAEVKKGKRKGFKFRVK